MAASINLEELALKSIEQYAALTVHIASLQAAIVDMNRRSEINQDRFSVACDKLARMEEKMSAWVDDRAVIHKRIDDTRLEVDKAAALVQTLADNVRTHSDHHCIGCENTDRVEDLEQQIEDYVNGNKDLAEVRDKMTSPQGMFLVRTMVSRWGLGWIALVTVSSLITIVNHYAQLKQLWDLLNFK